MRKNLKTALFIAVGLLLWLLSGLFFGESGPDNHPTLASVQDSARPAGSEPVRVRARIVEAEVRTRFVILRGRTESKRSVDVKAEIAGKIVSRPVERGMRVQRGDLLCELSIDDRVSSVTEAQAALEDAEIEYQGSLKLKEQGLQSQTAIARAKSRLETARAQLRRQDLNLERTRIVAPFAGAIEQLQMNVGDFASRGSVCATLLDLDPMLVSANVTEGEVEYLNLGDSVSGETSTGRAVRGKLTFIGKQSDPVTRTYPVEITVENGDFSLRSGLTTSVRIELDKVNAHLLSPALFTLNDRGEMGIRVVGESGVVEFYPVIVIEDTGAGAWVTGLPQVTRLITVGQEFVLAGQAVDAVYPQGNKPVLK
jgi:multidrug efflux system membrane fusion protein